LDSGSTPEAPAKTNFMSRRSFGPKRLNYKQDYVSYWYSKGSYGIERAERMLARKRARYRKMKDKIERRRRNYCPYCGRYGDGYECW